MAKIPVQYLENTIKTFLLIAEYSDPRPDKEKIEGKIWSLTRQVVGFSSVLAEDLRDTTLNSGIPKEVLQHQPIPNPLVIFDEPIEVLPDCRVQAILLLISPDGERSLFGALIDRRIENAHFSHWLSMPGLFALGEDMHKYMQEIRPMVLNHRASDVPEGITESLDIEPIVKLGLGCLLYLHSSAPDVQERTTKTPLKVGGLVGFVKPWDAGIRYSAAKRQWEAAESLRTSMDKSRPRPHLRRGHWRFQAYGKGMSLRKCIWISPMEINAEYGERVTEVRP